MPGVREVATVGVPDEQSGEAVKLVIVKKDPALTAEQIKAHARENLTGYKQPRYVEFRDVLPKSNVGKILRRELREESPAKADGRRHPRAEPRDTARPPRRRARTRNTPLGGEKRTKWPTMACILAVQAYL